MVSAKEFWHFRWKMETFIASVLITRFSQLGTKLLNWQCAVSVEKAVSEFPRNLISIFCIIFAFKRNSSFLIKNFKSDKKKDDVEFLTNRLHRCWLSVAVAVAMVDPISPAPELIRAQVMELHYLSVPALPSKTWNLFSSTQPVISSFEAIHQRAYCSN